jgi:hypothetical protein
MSTRSLVFLLPLLLIAAAAQAQSATVDVKAVADGSAASRRV